MAHYTLILAAGKGARFNSKTPKQFLEINGLPMIMHSVIAFNQAQPDSNIYIGLSKAFILKWNQMCKQYNFSIKHEIYVGGENRLDTVFLGLQKIQQSSSLSKIDLVSIHDAARPFIKPEFILNLIKEAKKYGSAIPFISLKNTLRKIKTESNSINTTCNRKHYIMTQTPQVFRFTEIFQSYTKMQEFNNSKTTCNNVNFCLFFDDASIYDVYTKKKPNLIPGKEYNIKITTEIDYFIADKIYEFYKNFK